MKKRTQGEIFVPPEMPPTAAQWAAEMARAEVVAPRRYTIEEVAGGCQIIRLSEHRRGSR